MSAKSEYWYELTVDQLSFKVGKEADEAECVNKNETLVKRI